MTIRIIVLLMLFVRHKLETWGARLSKIASCHCTKQRTQLLECPRIAGCQAPC